MQISSGKIHRPQRVVLYGPEGIGKTTLASQFPNPLFIDTEGSTDHIDVQRVEPAPFTWAMLLGYVDEVIAEPSLCETLVIDTADWAERLCIDHVLEQNNVKSIEEFGYGKGYTYLKEEFGKLLNKLSDVVSAGINVVVTAHSQLKKFEQPDQLGAYDRYELKLTRQNAPLLKEWADAVLFLNYKTMLVEPDKKSGGKVKAMGGKRVIYTSHTPAWDAKNRDGLAPELPMDYESIKEIVPSSERLIKAIDDIAEAVNSETQEIQFNEIEESNLKKLQALMEKESVTEKDIIRFSASRGYCPPKTDFNSLPDSYLKYLITNWKDLRGEIAIPF